jgi:hypothetical protein
MRCHRPQGSGMVTGVSISIQRLVGVGISNTCTFAPSPYSTHDPPCKQVLARLGCVWQVIWWSGGCGCVSGDVARYGVGCVPSGCLLASLPTVEGVPSCSPPSPHCSHASHLPLPMRLGVCCALLWCGSVGVGICYLLQVKYSLQNDKNKLVSL